MKSLFQSLAVLLLLLGVSMAFIVIKTGKCPKVPIKQNFDVTRYMGRWWEYQRFPAPFEYNSVCGFANYTLLSSTKVKVLNSGLQEFKIFGFTICRKPITAEGEATIVNVTESSKLLVSFANQPAGTVTEGEPNYYVVDTDYDNFAVVFSCSEGPLGLLNTQFAWILTRGRGVKPANLDQIYATLRQSGVDLTLFFTVEQNDCP